MKVACLQENLRRGVSIVARTVAGRSTLPVLANILMATDGGRLKLSSTNLEIGSTYWVGTRIEHEGSITVPAKLLADVVGGLPNDVITLSVDERTQTLRLECEGSVVNIMGIAADEFPLIPSSGDAQPMLSLPGAILSEIIEQVAFAAATDDTRPVLAGVCLRLSDGDATFIASNGYRLSVQTTSLAAPVNDAPDVIIPARALIELARNIVDAEDTVAITITPSGGQILFHTSQIEIVSRLIDGKYPDVTRLIPNTYATRAVLDTAQLSKIVRLASYVASSSANILRMTIEPGGESNAGTLTLSANAEQIGDNQSTLAGTIDGANGHIALNVQYVAEALNTIHTPQVALEIQSDRSPAVFRQVGRDDYVHVIMPMHNNEQLAISN